MASQTQTRSRQEQADYQQFARRRRPRPSYLKNCLWAFGVGGAIALVGQLITGGLMALGLGPEQASARAAVVLIFLGAALTAAGVYDEIARFGGAGAAIPITGFANSIVAPAMEFAREGYVFGMAARMFQVAGPVIVFGVAAATLSALARWLLMGGGGR